MMLNKFAEDYSLEYQKYDNNKNQYNYCTGNSRYYGNHDGCLLLDFTWIWKVNKIISFHLINVVIL